MSIEARIKLLERKQTVQEQHIHWLVPDASGGMSAPSPRECQECIEADYNLHYLNLVDFNSLTKPFNEKKKQKEPSHARG